jgi:hypothetical protein
MEKIQLTDGTEGWIDSNAIRRWSSFLVLSFYESKIDLYSLTEIYGV